MKYKFSLLQCVYVEGVILKDILSHNSSRNEDYKKKQETGKNIKALNFNVLYSVTK